ncbi:hypothetical protein Tco_0716147 [Tanacetum coccineum]
MEVGNEEYETTVQKDVLLLWGDLKTLFEPNEEDELWKNHKNTMIKLEIVLTMLSSVLLMNTGVFYSHDDLEKKYPLTQEMLSRMLNRRLEFEECLDTSPDDQDADTKKLDNYQVHLAQILLDFYLLTTPVIVSRLAILGVVITQEDLNSNFLRSLPPEWNTHVVVWMNKADIETMSIDDLYNNFKIVEQDDLEKIHEDDLEAMDLKLALLSPRNKEGQFKYQDNTRKQGNNEDTSSKEMLAIDGVGFDWSDMAEETVPQTKMA